MKHKFSTNPVMVRPIGSYFISYKVKGKRKPTIRECTFVVDGVVRKKQNKIDHGNGTDIFNPCQSFKEQN